MPPTFRLALALFAMVLSAMGAESGSLLGQKAPEWESPLWLNSPPLSLEKLRGKVVLIRWWTAPGCPYCSATAPALHEFQQQHRDAGLVVLGFYHHKSPEPFTPESVMSHAKRLGFEFPIAVDPQWQTLNRWWLNSGREQWTSVSFLLDRKGVVRHIHPGGQYVKGDAAYAAMKAKIEELIAEE